jgi:hypothetical protein
MFIGNSKKNLKLPLVLFIGITLTLALSLLKHTYSITSESAGQNEESSFFKSASFDKDQQNQIIEDLAILEDKEDKEEEIHSFKKHLGYHISASIIHTQALECFINSNKVTSPFNKFLSNASSSKYLLFQVFRI